MPKRSELEEIPGVGKSIADDLNQLGIFKVADLKGKDPQVLYDRFCKLQGRHIDRCLLYTFRCAVYYATETKHELALLKWWNWKDK